MSKINTFTLEHHKSLFTNQNDKKDYFFVQIEDHPYIDIPYRAESYAIEFLKKGSIVMQTQLDKIVIEAPAILALGSNVIRSFSKNSEEILMDIIFFKPDFFLESQANIFFLSQYEFFENSYKHVFPLNKKTKPKFEPLFSLIQETLKEDHFHQASILRSYLYILIYELDSIKQNLPNKEIQNPLFEKFKELLVKNFIKHRSPSYYANSLNVTRKYLSEVIKNNSGKTTREWIEEIVILEAKILLQNKSLTINQISNTLHFSNQSVFGKFFKNCTGFSPLEYRNNS
ncbi:helix-turn-helix domain-containing protein [Flavobacterium branchiicola]|uniref:Helix-turn-helix domain-containing protein n=1 Tax=Flavobacterium branchiicola TaxID=1114875 RepID=A0ABV9PAK6_9FLAO|nr:helix-turn-helix domain-containing protein [Flavobacterium branchiicola]MBS7253715.1 AraC family transcriptional regulator [Flavobacterium branchiicola]